MKWDYSTTPPRAWKIEDGECVPVDPRDVFHCPVCDKWFVKHSVENVSVCSPGCALKLGERLLANRKS